MPRVIPRVSQVWLRFGALDGSSSSGPFLGRLRSLWSWRRWFLLHFIQSVAVFSGEPGNRTRLTWKLGVHSRAWRERRALDQARELCGVVHSEPQ